MAGESTSSGPAAKGRLSTTPQAAGSPSLDAIDDLLKTLGGAPSDAGEEAAPAPEAAAPPARARSSPQAAMPTTAADLEEAGVSPAPADGASEPGAAEGLAISSELGELLREARQGAPGGAPEFAGALSEADSLVGEVLGEDRFVGEESLCPACGSVTSIYLDRCATCGSVFDKELCQCGHCGEWIPSESLFCGYCTKSLLNLEALCPKCFASVPANAEVCPHCQSELASNEMRCAGCGGPVSGSAVSCTSCGTVLIEGARTRSDALVAVATGAAPGMVGPYAASGTAGVQVGQMKATIEGGTPTEVEVENRIENRIVVEAQLKSPEVKVEGGEGGVAAGPGGPGGPSGPQGKQVDEDLQRKMRAKLAKAKGRRTDSLFPFTAIMGQEKMKTALLLNVVDPLVGGVLISGQKGTAKSVTVRGLTEVTPEIRVIDECRFSCDPARPGEWCWECRERFEGRTADAVPSHTRPLKVVDLPLNATEDRVVGTLDVGRMLTEGVVAFEHGVLAEANRGILYVDEINLLDDYVVDVLLDAAAMGLVTVEREGISVSYPARFVLVGSMNPEEGSLRPQLLDRIALQVNVTGIENLNDRKEIVKRRQDFETDPRGFRGKYAPVQEQVRTRVTTARSLLPQVSMPPTLFGAIPKVTTTFGVDGHRADIMIERGAKAMAALEGRKEVTSGDLGAVAEMVLPHRMRRKPFEQAEFSAERLRRVIEESV